MKIVTPITPDGLTGFDKFNQLIAWTKPDEGGYQTGRFIHDVRACTCYICGRGWGNTTEELVNQCIDGERTMHQTCRDGVRKITSHKTIQDALVSAGFIFSMEEVPPRYPHSTPWQRVKILCNDEQRTDSGYRIVLGRRKRVWELRLHHCGDVGSAFEDVPHTKGFTPFCKEDLGFGEYFYVHAWEESELIDFLTRFHRCIPASVGGRFGWEA